MHRRTFVASLGAGLAGSTGCLGRTGSPVGRPTNGTPRNVGTPSETPPRSDAPVSLTPPSPASDVFSGFECPSFDDAADRTVCYHAVEPDDVDVVLAVDPEVFDPFLGDGSVEVLRFTLYNQSTWYFQFNPYDWGIERHEDGEWVHVAPDAVPEPLAALPPGETYTWELPSELHPTPNRDRYVMLDLALSAGVYAFHVAGWFGAGFDEGRSTTAGPRTSGPTPAEPPEERIECVGLVRLEDDVNPNDPDDPAQTTVAGTDRGG